MRKMSAHWTNVSFQPPRFVAKGRPQNAAASAWTTGALRGRFPEKKISITHAERKPVTLHALAKHWVEVVQPEFPLLTSEQISWLEKSDGRDPEPQPPSRLQTIIAAGVYAVSSALIARDCNPDFEKLERCSLTDLGQTQENTQTPGAAPDDAEPQRGEIIALLFKALHQLVKPSQQNINLHVFINLISRRYTQYFGSKDSPVRTHKPPDQVGICLYILERYRLPPSCQKYGLTANIARSACSLDCLRHLCPVCTTSTVHGRLTLSFKSRSMTLNFGQPTSQTTIRSHYSMNLTFLPRT